MGTKFARRHDKRDLAVANAAINVITGSLVSFFAFFPLLRLLQTFRKFFSHFCVYTTFTVYFDKPKDCFFMIIIFVAHKVNLHSRRSWQLFIPERLCGSRNRAFRPGIMIRLPAGVGARGGGGGGGKERRRR